MSRAAVALATPDLEQQMVKLGRPVRGRRTMSRRAWLAVGAIVVVTVWLAFVFARALGDVDHATAKQQTMAAEAATLQARLDADHRELLLVQTDAFQRLQARAYGMGAPGEVIFSLPQDAPSPPPITPLGGRSASDGDAVGVKTPLDAWLQILFGN